MISLHTICCYYCTLCVTVTVYGGTSEHVLRRDWVVMDVSWEDTSCDLYWLSPTLPYSLVRLVVPVTRYILRACSLALDLFPTVHICGWWGDCPAVCVERHTQQGHMPWWTRRRWCISGYRIYIPRPHMSIQVLTHQVNELSCRYPCVTYCIGLTYQLDAFVQQLPVTLWFLPWICHHGQYNSALPIFDLGPWLFLAIVRLLITWDVHYLGPFCARSTYSGDWYATSHARNLKAEPTLYLYGGIRTWCIGCSHVWPYFCMATCLFS